MTRSQARQGEELCIYRMYWTIDQSLHSHNAGQSQLCSWSVVENEGREKGRVNSNALVGISLDDMQVLGSVGVRRRSSDMGEGVTSRSEGGVVRWTTGL